ncbi:hypothetical protein BTTAP_40041 [Brochothrix thermosphacta]|uniref:Uncharacterized protein n=1 Tax=Brochothrix thermosphacta TaxID=2756 RepID=A0A2X0QQ76_BROTH|nr:hypothetical protein FM106_22675 [Brachybacterium faecium]SOC19102.1 hypothetical protein BTH160X_220058 [Brochothrix thermosphacta]SPN74608.1 hypothetical protein BTEBP_100060 [Brochothrix thermosphacta]SPP29560.1 hypothetical protein BTTAP_40041 [Brochothrix thermosphacta]SPP30845.1 hypothetical protein BTBSAS_90059 [Brochothrix thermosphacta]
MKQNYNISFIYKARFFFKDILIRKKINKKASKTLAFKSHFI